ncbi:MAG TPA: ATP-binding protein [Rhizomicrobium sp.]
MAAGDTEAAPTRVPDGTRVPSNADNIDLNFLATAAVLALAGVALLAFPGIRTPTLHTILDTSISQASAVLALLFWQVGGRAGQSAARILAIAFTAVTVAEIAHTFMAIEWSAAPGAADSAVVHRLTGTWGPAAYLFPISLLLLPVFRSGTAGQSFAFAVCLLALGAALLWLFDVLPRFTEPGFLGITRPSLLPVLALWLAVASLYWRHRKTNDATRAFALMAMLLVPSSAAILFSHGPYDAAALFGHLGKLAAGLFFLLSITQVGARSTARLERAESDLQAFNSELERRIRERTAQLESTNETLVAEAGLRRKIEHKLHMQVERLNLLNQITRAIGDRLDLNSIFQIVVRSLEDRLPVDFAAALLFDPVRRKLTVGNVGVRSAPLASELAMAEQAEIEIDGNGLSHCIAGDLVYEPDISGVSFPFPMRLARGGLRSLVISPLIVGGHVFGLFVIARRAVSDFNSSDCEFLKQLCEHVSLAVHQAELRGTLQRAYDDLKQTQQAAMQQERMRAIGQMASGIAHDINNAISPVAIYTQSLLETAAGQAPAIRSYLQTVQRVVNDVAATISRLREFYRPREEQIVLRPVALNELVEQVIDLTRARWSDIPQQRGIAIEIRRDLDANLPDVPGVDGEIREALTNLVFNAADAMPDGGRLTVSTRTVEIASQTASGQPIRRVQLAVSDTGAGMSEAVLRRCFEPFYTTKGERGTGLGLAMVQAAAQRHNAEIGIDSELGKGTTITLTFPIARGGADAAKVPLAPAPRSALRLLLIDDDPFVLDAMRTVLELEGHSVAEANSGRAGIDMFLECLAAGRPFDVVITDLGMPNVDGNQVIETLKAASGDTPIILLTGWGRRLDAPGRGTSRADFILPKPPDLEELRATFAQIQRRGGG